MIKYVLGFAFDDHGDHVALIRKNKPAWQAGLWNGVGGKIEEGESPLEAMRREFFEETGTTIDEWVPFADMKGQSLDWAISCFYQFDSWALDNLKSTTAEKVQVHAVPFAVRDLTTISNLPWLITAALNHKQNGCEFYLTADYA